MENGGIKSKDEKFLLVLDQLVLDNLDNAQFSVEELARLKGISRSHLHRKLKLLKGKSVSQYIRETRLKEAMKLLRKDVANVSEIGYSVGFSSTSYFNTCFHSYYGYPPGKVKKGYFEKGEKVPAAHSPAFINGKEPSLPEIEIKSTNHLKYNRSQFNKVILFSSIIGIVLLLAFAFIYISKSRPAGKFPRAIAILPFDHLSETSDQEYLTAGIHDALIGELGAIQGLRVVSRTSTLKYPDSKMNIKEIAKELGVDAIVEGSVLISGDSLRLQLQLIDVFPEEQHIWAQNYHKGIDNILSMQSNAIQGIANSIQIRLTSEEKDRLEQAKNRNPETYKAYLRGIFYLNKSTQEDFQKGLAYLHEAIALDPANPLAYASLAEGYIILGHGPDPAEIHWQRARAAARKAIEIDSNLAKAHAALAIVKLYHDSDWEGAERSFIKANTLNSNMAFNHFHYAWYHVLMGQMEQALREHKLAKELDALTPIITADMGSLYYWLGRNDEAITELEQAIELDKDFGHAWWMLGSVYLNKGRFDKALIAHSKAVEINAVWKWALADTYARTGEENKALEIIAELKQPPITPRNAFGLIRIYTSLGDIDNAIYWLHKEPHDVWIPWLRTWPGFEPLRNDPRFAEFLNSIGLPPLATTAT